MRFNKDSALVSLVSVGHHPWEIFCYSHPRRFWMMLLMMLMMMLLMMLMMMLLMMLLMTVGDKNFGVTCIPFSLLVLMLILFLLLLPMLILLRTMLNQHC